MNINIAQRGVLPLFGAAIGLSAVLVFAVQPMFATMVLPLLGGAPNVWNTAMLFFQTMLLAGYLYTHLTTRWLSVRRQAWLHITVMLAVFLVLPIGVAEGWQPPTDAAPVPWLIGLFAVSVGLPFFAVAANAPLLQYWFSHSRHGAAADPYFLYGASNLGSIAALVGYPIIIAPLFRLEQQSWLWAGAFGLLVLFVASCAMLLGRPVIDRSATPAPASSPVGWGRRWHWAVLAFAPSSLLLGVTRHITTDIASVPLLWVIPLTIYLLSYVLTFARRPLLRHHWMVELQTYLVILLAITFWWRGGPPMAHMALHLATFFVIAMVCHGELVARRPAAGDLTEFYLWLAFGGMLGGVFNVLIAPNVFNVIWEYPLILVVACMLRPSSESGAAFARWSDLVWPALLFAVFGLPVWLTGIRPAAFGVTGESIYLVGLGLGVFALQNRPLRFGLGIAAVLTAALLATTWAEVVVTRARSFYGVHSVVLSADRAIHELVHGTTLHGAQYRDPARRREALTYFHRDGPLGQLFTARNGFPKVGVVGLGAGTVACYRRPGEDWMFFEIDPTVVRLARDERYFHYLSECAPDATVVLGDARLSLATTPDGVFDLLILDAFSSDAVPVHLMTREALALYIRKLAPGGIIAFHVTNRNLALDRVIVNTAASAGLAVRMQHYNGTRGIRRSAYLLDSDWAVIARYPADLAFLDGDERWRLPMQDEDVRPWSDDYSNILSVLKW